MTAPAPIHKRNNSEALGLDTREYSHGGIHQKAIEMAGTRRLSVPHRPMLVCSLID